MIEKIEDFDLKETDSVEEIDSKIKEKLGVSVPEMQEALSKYVISNAEELTLQLVNIAPLGDYSKLLEDNDSMADFLKSEANKPEHWLLNSLRLSDVNSNLLSFEFINDAIDDGDSFKGFVFVSLQGKIKHAFAQGDDN
jgi:hypothetical protein